MMAPLPRSLLYAFLFVGSVGVLLPYGILTAGGRGPAGPHDPWAWLGLIPLLSGVGLCGRCVLEFATAGRGTPAPFDSPRSLVVTGPYRRVRNPMYLGMLLVLLGEALLFGSVRLLAYAGVAALAFHLFVVLHEEPALKRRFGESYERYRRAVRRWAPGSEYRAEGAAPFGR